LQQIFSFICATCGQLHEGSPSVGYSAPFHWQEAHRTDVTGTSRLNDDFCMIERRDYFIRCILEVPIHDVEEPFLWGVWVTQSEQNFKDYADCFHDTPEAVPSAISPTGYLAIQIPLTCIRKCIGKPDAAGRRSNSSQSTIHFFVTGQRESVGSVRPNWLVPTFTEAIERSGHLGQRWCRYQSKISDSQDLRR
jgi:hypothetical protein